MSDGRRSSPRPRATSVTLGYLCATAVLIVLWGRGLAGWPWLVAAHALVGLGLLALARWSRPPVALTILRDWHPLVLFPVLYKEVELLASAIGDWRLTSVIPAWEAALFGGQPAMWLAESLPFVPLSEFLHFCYFAYVLVIPGVAAYWYWGGRRAAFADLVWLLALVMFGHYLFFVLWPVDSPFYLFDRLGPPLDGHVFISLVQEVSSRGGARGGAFPSAHAAGATVLWIVAWRHHRGLAVLLLPIVLGLLVATVYGRFHYAVDTLAGVVAALVVATVAGTPRPVPRVSGPPPLS